MQEQNKKVVYRYADGWEKRNDSPWCETCNNPISQVYYHNIRDEVNEKMAEDGMEDYEVFACPHKTIVLIWDFEKF